MVKMPEPITAPIPSDVKLTQPSDFLSCLSGFSESEISRSIFLVRKSCAPNRHLPGRKREESTLCNSSTQHLTSRRSRPEALSNHLVVQLDASGGLNPEALWAVGGHKPKKRRRLSSLSQTPLSPCPLRQSWSLPFRHASCKFAYRSISFFAP
jgi:hypothetical protein